MNSIGFMVCLLVAAATTPSDRDTIELLVVGPPDVRKQMEDALRPLLSADPALRWAEQESMPPDGALPGSKGESAAQLWVDVSSPSQLRLYLPAEQSQGTTIVRTVARAARDGTSDDLLARETFAQVVRAAAVTMRGRLARRAEEAEQRRRDEERRSWQAVHLHDGLSMRAQAGLGHLSASETYASREDSYSKLGLALNLALGFALTKNLILQAELAMTAVRSASNAGASASLPYARDLILVSVGPGVTYYLHGNYRVSGSLGYAKLWFFADDSGQRLLPDSDRGFAGSVGVGREWMLSHRWGLGIEGRFGYALLEHSFRIEWAPVYGEAYRPTIHATTYALLLTATFD